MRKKARVTLGYAVSFLGSLLIPPAAPADDAKSDQKPNSAEAVFYSLVKKNEPGMTEAEAKEYLRKYDPRYSDPRLAAYAKSHPDFQQFQEQNLAADAHRLIETEGVAIPGSSNKALSKERFVQITTKAPATLKKAPPPNRLALLTGGVLSDEKLSVTKSTTVQGDEKRPAQFGWTDSRSGSFFTVDGALTYKWDNLSKISLPGGYTLEPILNPSIEAHTTTQAPSKRQQDSISAKIPIELGLSSATASVVAGNTFLITPDYERDRKKTIETFSVNVLWSPTLSPPSDASPGPIMLIRTGQLIPFSQILPGSRLNYPGLIWRPYVGFETGDRITSNPKDIDAAKAYDGQNEYSRFVATVHTDFYLTPKFDIACDFTHRTFLSGSGLSFDYVEVSPVFYLDGTPNNPDSQRWSLGMTYKNGKTTPQFKDVESVSAWVGIRY